MRYRPSIPFSLTLLALMGVIVAPLAGMLLWLGGETAESLEQRNVDNRMTSLDSAVESFLYNGLQQMILLGATLSESPNFQSAYDTDPEPDDADAERLRQLANLLQRHPLIAAAYVGYVDAYFLYAGRLDSLSAQQRAEYGAPPGATIILRHIAGDGAERRETWWFRQADGTVSAPRSRPAEYDPRTRPWYIEARERGGAALTDPYLFANADVVGISAAVPLLQGRGVFGFDITLDTLSAVIARYKITPNSIIMVGNVQGRVFAQTRACPPSEPGCLPGGGEARQALSAAIGRAEPGRKTRGRVGEAEAEYELIVEPMPELLGRRFVVAAAVPLAEIAAESHALMRKAAIAAAVAVGLAIVAALLGAHLLALPLRRIARKTERIRHLDFSDHVPVQSAIREIGQLSQSVERMRDGLEVFGRYVSRGLVEQIMRSPERAGLRGVRRDVTVMFTDIEGFSLIAEGLPPEVLTRRLSHYFEVVEPAIAGNRGTIDKYIGDSIMAYWNAPELDDEHVAHACRAALQLAQSSQALAAKWQKRGRPPFRTRIGVHTGRVVVGNVGTRERINYTMVGAVANQASRLEGLNKVYGTDILVSGETMAAVADRFVWRAVDRVVAAGTTETHDIYEPLGELAPGERHAEHAGFLAAWQAARDPYLAGRFEAALAGFEAARALRPGDGPVHVFIERCQKLRRDGPPAGWDGTWHFEVK